MIGGVHVMCSWLNPQDADLAKQRCNDESPATCMLSLHLDAIKRGVHTGILHNLHTAEQRGALNLWTKKHKALVITQS